MNPGRYFMPMMRQNPMMYANTMATRGSANYAFGGLLGRLGNTIKNINWKSFFGGVNKTLNVVNQTIPLVRQAKPMFDNVRSMILLTKTFRKETNNSNNYTVNKKNMPKIKDNSLNLDIQKQNTPIFFI